MSHRGTPLEQPYLKALIKSALDYLLNQHGRKVIDYVQEWFKDKDIAPKLDNENPEG